MLEEFGVLYRGVILGLVIAAPVGPVGLMCIRRTLQKGVINGMSTGFGSAVCDAFFGSIAVLGVSAILGLHMIEQRLSCIFNADGTAILVKLFSELGLRF